MTLTLSDTDKKTLQTTLIGGVVVLLGLLYYVWAVVNPQVAGYDKSIRDLNDQMEVKQEELKDVKKWEERKGEITAIVQQLGEKVKRLPQTTDPSEFLRILRECVQLTNLTDIRIDRPKPILMGAYDELPYMITCRARYHDLGQFLTLIEQHPQQILRVKTFEISNDAKRPSRHRVTLQLATFVFAVSKSQEVASK